MKTSDLGLQFVMRWEGTVLHPYKDSAGILTIGCGHVIRSGEVFANPISEQVALDLLRSDIGTAENAVNSEVKVSLTQNQFDALVSFVFNLGSGALAQSSLLRILNTGDYVSAAQDFMMWDKVNGVPNQGILNRRKSESELFMTPDSNTVSLPVVQVIVPVPVVAIPSNHSVTLPTIPGESATDRIIRIVKSYVGASLVNRRADLGALVARGVDKPESVVTIATNCGTSALGIMALAGVKHPLLSKPYQSGMAISWLRQIGTDLGALQKFSPANPPRPGCLMRYNTAGKNDDHVEWLLGPLNASGFGDHGGGGRANNAITEGIGGTFSSLGRPLVEWWDVDKLGIDVLPVALTEASDAQIKPTPVNTIAPPAAIVPASNATSTIQAIIKFITTLYKMFMSLKLSK